jgi:probable addiction module antidote protein
MPRGRWKPSDEQVAQEAFVVLIQGKKPTRTYSKEVLLQNLRDSSVALDFLKLCLEWDNTGDLQLFKKGLLCVVQARGATALAKSTGVSRVTLYRMLSSSGNPRLSSLTALFRKLGFRLYLVDEDFIRRREKITRPKDR